ncbi:MAG: ATP-dependent DNA helicase RecG [Agathobacter sp.]|nr:ATP-dependent DNA helicase RecG [Agathobacter sp.]MBQ2283248.1 ATP-dependent DNA helicase RecG [Agathobacter sp.]
MKYNSPITDVKGIGAKTKDSFAKMGVYTVGDILLSFPRTYIQYPKMEDINELTSLTEEHHAIVARVQRTPVVKNTARMSLTLLDIGSEGHKMQLIWYRMPYLKSTLTFGKYFVFYGKVTIKNQKYVMEQPVIYEVEKYQAMEEQFMPVYSLTAGITNNLMTKTLQSVLSQENLLMDYLPAEIRKENELCEYNYAIKQIHFPDSMDTLISARNRLVFDEFFLFLMGIQYQKEATIKEENTFSFKQDSFVEDLIAKLPYELTGAQLRSIGQIKEDMSSPYVMQRLLQGDVGSGKTIVAFLMMAWCSYSGYQSAIMAPTEVLARQHYESYLKLCQDFGLNYPVIFLSGSMTAREKRNAYERLQLFPNAMIIGTHALIQDKVEFAELALVITDEQHRFGVKQRDVFAGKGHHPHILVMSATPIPRTLAIIIYGDMDISVIDEVPAKRLPIKNCVVNQGYRPKAYEFMEQQIKEGHQVYIICPLVEETENSEGENVIDYAKKLSRELSPEIQIGILHGKMKPALKNEVMEAFEKNEVQILVSTTVVEVGVNVPNATVMMVENADKFGLAQLHQLRGRVGRGDAQSYCIMVNTSSSKTAKKRLEILNKSNDGFFIASEDLKLRGPGDFFGIRQSGDIAFQLADIYQDADVLMKAQEAVKDLLEEDPLLEAEEHQVLFQRMQGYMETIIL